MWDFLKICALGALLALNAQASTTFAIQKAMEAGLKSATTRSAVLARSTTLVVENGTRTRMLTFLGGKSDPRFWRGATHAIDGAPASVLIELRSGFKYSAPRLSIALEFPGRGNDYTAFHRALRDAISSRLRSLGIADLRPTEPRVIFEDFSPFSQVESMVPVELIESARALGIPMSPGGRSLTIRMEALTESEVQTVIRECLDGVDVLVNEGIPGLSGIR